MKTPLPSVVFGASVAIVGGVLKKWDGRACPDAAVPEEPELQVCPWEFQPQLITGEAGDLKYPPAELSAQRRVCI